jgi:hypothetical protein
VPEAGGEGLLELRQGAQGRLLDAGDRPRGRRPQTQGHGDRLLVVEQQRRHRRARCEAVAPGGSRAGTHLVAQDPQPLDVVADRPGGDAEVARAVAGLVEAPAGQRPLRTTVGPNAEGAAVINHTTEQVQQQFLQALGMGDLLQVNAPSPTPR